MLLESRKPVVHELSIIYMYSTLLNLIVKSCIEVTSLNIVVRGFVAF